MNTKASTRRVAERLDQTAQLTANAYGIARLLSTELDAEGHPLASRAQYLMVTLALLGHQQHQAAAIAAALAGEGGASWNA